MTRSPTSSPAHVHPQWPAIWSPSRWDSSISTRRWAIVTLPARISGHVITATYFMMTCKRDSFVLSRCASNSNVSTCLSYQLSVGKCSDHAGDTVWQVCPCQLSQTQLLRNVRYSAWIFLWRGFHNVTSCKIFVWCEFSFARAPVHDAQSGFCC